MKIFTLLAAISFLAACNSPKVNSESNTGNVMGPTQTIEPTNQRAPNIVHRFIVPSIDGGEVNFVDYRGKKILIVNTASECGYTKQYEGLEKLYNAYKDKLVVVGVPANNFGGQEPGTNEAIASFCKKNYGVTFPLTAKLDVVGDNQHPLFNWLTKKEHNGVLDATIGWNFNKFLIDEQGNVLAHFPSKVEPMSKEILQYLQ